MYKRDLATIARKKLGQWSAIWKSVASTKVKCFTWLVTRRACLTHDKFQKRGRTIASRCYLCKAALETNNHMFLHCKVTTQVWAIFTNLASLNWIMLKHTIDLLSCWARRRGNKSQGSEGEQYQLEFGGSYGRREIKEFL